MDSEQKDDNLMVITDVGPDNPKTSILQNQDSKKYNTTPCAALTESHRRTGCCAYPNGPCLAYIFALALLIMDLIILIVMGVCVLKPRLHAQTFQPSNCMTVWATDAGTQSCEYGRTGNRGARYAHFPCKQVLVKHTNGNHKGVEGILYANELVHQWHKCSFRPSCTRYESIMKGDVEQFVNMYGVNGKAFRCLYDPEQPSSIVLELKGGLKQLFTLMYSLAAFGILMIICLILLRAFCGSIVPMFREIRTRQPGWNIRKT